MGICKEKCSTQIKINFFLGGGGEGVKDISAPAY